MTKKRRYQILLDEGLFPRRKLPLTNNYHDIKHVKLDFKSGKLPDISVYQLAKSQKRLIATLNVTDFENLLTTDEKHTGIISISSTLTPEEIDKKLCALLNRSKPSELYGKIAKITGETGKK